MKINPILVAIAAITMFIVQIDMGRAQTSSDLQNALLSANCQRACLWGIEPEVTTKVDVESTLNTQAISFVVKRIGADFGQLDYTGPFQYQLEPFRYYSCISPSTPVEIYTNGEGPLGDVAIQINIPAINLSRSDVIDAFGYPDAIVDSFDTSHQYLMVYPSLGTMFTVDTADQNHQISDIHLLAQRFVDIYYDDPAFTVADPCNDDPNLCDLVTATPQPGDVTSPTLDLQTSIPANNAADIATNMSQITMTFDEPVSAGRGQLLQLIELQPTRQVVASIDVVATGQVTFNGNQITVDLPPGTILKADTTYAIQVGAQAIQDAAGNFFVGIADDTTWTFTTAMANQIGCEVRFLK